MDGLTFFLKQLCFDQADPNFEYFVLYLYLYLIGNALNTPFFFFFSFPMFSTREEVSGEKS